MIFMSGFLARTSSKPFFRSIAGAEPTVPTNSAMFALPPVNFTASFPARRPSSIKSEPRKLTYSDGSETFTARSDSTTGIPAFFASCNTGSNPVSTTGENAITSTPSAMNERIALIWFSSFCWASEKRRSMPRLAASALIESVLAVRQPLSAPT